MLTKILSLALVIALGLAGYLGYQYKQAEGAFNVSQLAYGVLKSDKEECETLILDNTKAIKQLEKDLSKKPTVVTHYETKVKTVYETLTKAEKSILDTELPADVIRLLDDSSKDTIR